jgi:hypothetical protein
VRSRFCLALVLLSVITPACSNHATRSTDSPAASNRKGETCDPPPARPIEAGQAAAALRKERVAVRIGGPYEICAPGIVAGLSTRDAYVLCTIDKHAPPRTGSDRTTIFKGPNYSHQAIQMLMANVECSVYSSKFQDHQVALVLRAFHRLGGRQVKPL